MLAMLISISPNATSAEREEAEQTLVQLSDSGEVRETRLSAAVERWIELDRTGYFAGS